MGKQCCSVCFVKQIHYHWVCFFVLRKLLWLFSSRRKIIEKSIKKIEEISCFRFPKRTSEKNYLDIDKRDGCYSFVGKIGGRQILSLSGGCIYSFIIIHELFHVLGIEHEHQRPDRDQFIKIIYNNVDPDKMSNFALISPNDVYYKEHPYDYRSIMHYDGTAFGKNDPKTGKKLATMVPLQVGQFCFRVW